MVRDGDPRVLQECTLARRRGSESAPGKSSGHHQGRFQTSFHPIQAARWSSTMLRARPAKVRKGSNRCVLPCAPAGQRFAHPGQGLKQRRSACPANDRRHQTRGFDTTSNRANARQSAPPACWLIQRRPTFLEPAAMTARRRHQIRISRHQVHAPRAGDGAAAAFSARRTVQPSIGKNLRQQLADADLVVNDRHIVRAMRFSGAIQPQPSCRSCFRPVAAGKGSRFRGWRPLVGRWSKCTVPPCSLDNFLDDGQPQPRAPICWSRRPEHPGRISAMPAPLSVTLNRLVFPSKVDSITRFFRCAGIERFWPDCGSPGAGLKHRAMIPAARCRRNGSAIA